MKKTFIKLLTISALALSACTGTGSNTSAAGSDIASDTPSSQQPQVEALFEITPDKTSYDVEVGENFTPKFKVKAKNSANDNLAKTLSFEIEGQDDNKLRVTSSGNHNSAVFGEGTSVKLYGKRVGSVTLVATSTADPNSFVRIPITVSKALPTLAKTWEKVNALTNYTLNITKSASSDEIKTHGWDEDTMVPYKKISVTQNALLIENATSVTDDLVATYGPAYTSSETGAQVLGLGVDKDDHVAPFLKDAKGNLTLDNKITGGDGFISSDEIAGLGSNAKSPNSIQSIVVGTQANPEVIFFGGLQVVNPSWLSGIEKDYSNVYDVEGYDEEREAAERENYQYAFFECALWMIADSTGFQESLTSHTSTSGSASFIDISNDIETEVTVLGDSNLSVTLTKEDGTIFSIEIADAGKTVTPSDYVTYLTSAEASTPELDSEVKGFTDAIATADYYTEYDSNGTVYATAYYGKNYQLNLYSEEYKAENSKAQDGGYAYVNNKVYELNYTPAVKDAEGNVTTPEQVTIGKEISFTTTGGQKVETLTQNDFYEITFNFAGCPVFNDPESGYIYSFTSGTYSGATYLDSQSEAVNQLVSYFYFGGATFDQICQQYSYTIDDHVIEISPSKSVAEDEDGNKTVVYNGFQLLVGSITVNGQSGRCFGSDFTFNCKSKNPDLINAVETAIAAKAAA